MKNLEMKSEGKIKSIALSKLLAHPDNPNSMSEATFRKLVANIERTGLYEPIVVRVHPEKQNCYQIINGHHRVKALEQLGRYEADCVVWDVDDGETAVLLTTLNRLCGSDIPVKKVELFRKLTQRMETKQLAKLLPQTARQIERLANLKLNSIPIKLNGDSFAVPLVFFVTKEQQGIIERAIEKLDSRVRRNDKMTNAQRRAVGITEMAEQYLREVEKCQK